jgi:hypothetical protein
VAISKAFAISAQNSAAGAALTTGAFSSVGYTHLVVGTKHETNSTAAVASDNKGSPAFTALTKQAIPAATAWAQLHYVKIGTPGTGHTVTMTTNAASDWRTLLVWLVNVGTGTIDLVDAKQANGTGTAINAGTLSNASARSVVSMLLNAESTATTYTIGSGWTEDFDTDTYGESRGPESTTSIAADATSLNSMGWAVSAMFAELGVPVPTYGVSRPWLPQVIDEPVIGTRALISGKWF